MNSSSSIPAFDDATDPMGVWDPDETGPIPAPGFSDLPLEELEDSLDGIASWTVDTEGRWTRDANALRPTCEADRNGDP
jgi:hypothetical protein